MEEKLNDYQKSVLSNGETLRAKLLIYLQEPEAVEYYAKTAEKCFLQGNKEKFAKGISWSLWWGLIYGWIFLLYRKSKKAAKWFFISLSLYIVSFLISFFISFILSPSLTYAIIEAILTTIFWIACFYIYIHLGMYSRYYILETFVDILGQSNGDDSILAFKG